MGYVIGIDIGTGSTKAVAVSGTAKVLEVCQASYPTLQPQPTYSEQDADVIWNAVVKCITDLTALIDDTPIAVVLSSAMHSILLTDDNGKPISNMITWADNRSASVAEELRRSAYGELIYNETGTPIHAMSPLCKIIWMKDHAQPLFKRAAHFISIKTYIWFRLFGVYETDYAIASAMGMFNIENNQWNERSLKLCGLRAGQLGELVPTDHSRPAGNELATRLNLSESTLFVIGSSDGCLANVGSFATTPGTAALTIGTSGAIRVAGERPTLNYSAMIFNYKLFDDLFISGGPINNGGVVLKWYAEKFLQRTLASEADYEKLLDAISDTEPGANGLIFLPYLLGERAPIWNSEASGSFFGIRNYHSQAHFTRAVVEGISMALYTILLEMETAGLVIDKVHVSGGFVHSSEWLQILADMFNKPIVLIHDEDASAIGAALIGLGVAGLMDNLHLESETSRTTFMPRPEYRAVYDITSTVYRSLYNKMTTEMEALGTLRQLVPSRTIS
ncbi:gluconokinase [Chryseolinea sp. T2]|uniref:gluconokinase n=1 Tax=Chryseolinea sp. T2 TaxID=3129255 RepID=UPI0030776A02